MNDLSGQRILLAVTAVWGLLGVAMLAAGSHPPRVGLLATGGEMLLFHAAAVLALLNTQLVTGWRRAAPVALMLTGSGLFAVALGLHALSGVAAFAMLAPVGGGLCILGWLGLAAGAAIEPKP